MGVAMIFLFGLFESNSPDFLEEHFIRVTDVADMPNLQRIREIKSSPGWKAGVYHQAKFGNRPGKCDVRGKAAVAGVRAELGDTLPIERLGQTHQGYFWKWRENPGKGFLIIIEDQPPAVHLRGWYLADKAKTSRVDTSVERQVYRWFEQMVGQ